MNKDDIVVVWTGQVFFGFWKPNGVRGKVAMLDKDAGVCVELFVSHAFKPCLWFPESEVALNPAPGWTPQSVAELESTINGGRKVQVPNSPIRFGILQSWVLAKLRATPGQSVYDRALELTETELMNMFTDASDRRFTDWAAANDTRPKRALISEDSEVGSTISPTVKRPRLV